MNIRIILGTSFGAILKKWKAIPWSTWYANKSQFSIHQLVHPDKVLWSIKSALRSDYTQQANCSGGWASNRLIWRVHFALKLCTYVVHYVNAQFEYLSTGCFENIAQLKGSGNFLESGYSINARQSDERMSCVRNARALNSHHTVRAGCLGHKVVKLA